MRRHVSLSATALRHPAGSALHDGSLNASNPFQNEGLIL